MDAELELMLGLNEWGRSDLVLEVMRLQAENAALRKQGRQTPLELEMARIARDSVQEMAARADELKAENAALRAQVVPNYSEQCPTQPGGYWMCKGGGGTPVLIELLHCSGELHVCHTDGMFYPLWKQFNDGWRFAGPIPEPKGGGDVDQG